MRLLLDSHIVIAFARKDLSQFNAAIEQVVLSSTNDKIVSVASLWEIAIKYRLRKLELTQSLEAWPTYLENLGLELLSIDPRHAIERLDESPPTRDPFDRMLLAQCQVEGLRLVTTDRALVGHPLAWRAP